jgi:hypothetical protein
MRAAPAAVHTLIQTVRVDGTTGVTNIAAAALSHRQILSTAGRSRQRRRRFAAGQPADITRR